MNDEESRREDSLSLSPLSGDMQRGYLVWTHRLHACAVGSGSRWASRTHQIIGRAPPREAVCQGDGVQRKTHNFSRWFVWWTNSMRTNSERREESRASQNMSKVLGREEEQMCVCAFVCLRASWLTYNTTKVERSNADWQHIRSLSHNIGFYQYFLTIPGVKKSKGSWAAMQGWGNQICHSNNKTSYIGLLTTQ